MPELAEVETVRRQIQKHMVGHRIKDVTADTSDRILFEFAKVDEVKKALTGAKISGTGRKGKYFWLELNRKPWPIFHLGMSGSVLVLDPHKVAARPAKIWSGAKTYSSTNEELRERLLLSRLILKADRGLEMALVDPRRFGRMWLSDDPLSHPRIQRLGYDPLLDFPPVATIQDRLKKRKKSIKSVLLDQSLFAGIGNWLADEILFQARLAPQHLASNLKPAQVKALYGSILTVVKKAVAVSAAYERFPPTWLFHERWGKNKNALTSAGKKIIHEDIGGRTTAWVPGLQK